MTTHLLLCSPTWQEEKRALRPKYGYNKPLTAG